jgi:3-oxoacyl-[acyl-carrier-protein] synthase-3
MLFHDIGIIGTGLWEGPVVTNDLFGESVSSHLKVKDPYRGYRDEDGNSRIAGMKLTPERHPRTLAAVERSYRDPFRGTQRRRFFPPDLKVSDAETFAAQKAIADAGITAEDLDAVLVQSFLPDEIQPKNSALIAHNLGICNAPAWEVDSICNSTITHAAVGASLIISGFARRVLCVQSVAYSRVRDPGVSSSVQEGDMASAFVLGPSPGTKIACSFRTDGRLHGAIKLRWDEPTGVATRRWWEHSQERLLIRFNAELQAQVMSEIAENAWTACIAVLERMGIPLEELDIMIAHQPMSWNSAFMADVLGLADGVVFDTFEEYANINSAGITASIHEARRIGRIRKGSKVLLFGPSAGYTYAAMAIHW